MPQFLEWFCDKSESWKVKTYRSNHDGIFEPKASIVALGDRFTLTADERLISAASKGDKLANMILAHEIAHYACGHHERSLVTEHFGLSEGPTGPSIIPPNLEELEANFGGTFFQCGMALMDRRWSARDLSSRAFADLKHIEKTREFVFLEVFQREFHKRTKKHQRVVL